MAAVNPKLRIYPDSFDEKSYTDVNRLSSAMLTQADILSPVVTKLFGKLDSRFPLMLSTEGRGAIKTIKSGDTLYKWPVMGKPKKSSVVAKTFYTTGDQPGRGKSEFKIAMVDRWFERGYQIESPDTSSLATIIDNPTQDADGTWVYTCKLTGSSQASFVPLTQLLPGKRWGQMFSVVGISGSKGRASRNQAPSMLNNQLSLLRHSYVYKGNVQNKVMVISIPTSNGVATYWSEWEAYLNTLTWKEECENNLWYSRFNRDTDGNITDKDIDSGEIMPMAAGMLEQIPNSSTYSYLTEEKISRTIRDVFYNSMAQDKKNIEIYVGTGSREEWNKGLKNALLAVGLQATSDKFVGGAPNSDNLVYGSYFGTYKHVDGHTATVKMLPLLDHGVRADKAPKHPVTGLPITSYDMYFIDQSNIDGQLNIQYVAEEGRQDIEFVVPGATMPKGYGNSIVRATDEDGSSVQHMKSLGVCGKCMTNSFKLTCDLA